MLRNGEKRDKAVKFLNRFSILFHALLACAICFVIEWVSRHSFLEACQFMVDRNLVFLYNSLIVFASLMLVYTVKRRALMRLVISSFWIFLGVINGCVLAKRVSPFGFTDITMIRDLFTMQSNYFSAGEAVIAIIAVIALLLVIAAVAIWGPKYRGKTHRVLGLLASAAVILMLPSVTDAAVSNNILSDYFENLAQGYKDYGFVYSFSSSVIDTGMSTPENYSEEAVNEVLAKIGTSNTAAASAEESADGTEEAQAAVKQEGIKTTSSLSASDAAAVSQESVSTEEETAAETEPAENEISAESEIPEEEGTVSGENPNIILVLLESFVDPEQIKFLNLSEEVTPNFHYLYNNYSSGYLEVPVVGAGTANTEFEVLTGMGLQFFGLGEYPYKTVLQNTNVESIASDLSELGYGTHAVHNNGGNFYSRAKIFSQMGFDTFTSKELMDIKDYTPLGTWPTDDILVGEVEKSLDYTPDQPDFVYTITVEGHGDYPKYQVLENPEIQVSGVEDEEMAYAWEYYVNQIHQVDEFIGELIDMLEQRDEETMVIMFGDHLPTMGLTEEDMVSGSIFKTQYVTWNNFGMKKTDETMTSYQLMADMTERLGIEHGTMFTFHQNRYKYAAEEEYQEAMELLQYDILYGDHYVYGGENPYPASDLIMGTEDVVIDSIERIGDYYFIRGQNFTKWSKAFINGEKVSTTYISCRLLRLKEKVMPEGVNSVVVNQMGSSNTVFRSSNEVTFERLSESESESETAAPSDTAAPENQNS